MKRTVLLLLLPTAAYADGRFELGVAAGGHAFSHTTELGSTDDNLDPGPASSGMIGARAAMPLTRRLAIEGELMVIPTKDDVLGDRAMVYALRAQVRFDLMTGRLRPFVFAGGGVQVLRTSSPQMSNDVDPAYHAGLGVRFAVSNTLDVRIDAKDLVVPDRTRNGATDDYEVTAGVTFRFGHDAMPVAIAPPPPPRDQDGDGITDDLDKCPTQPEDKDGFEDADGCPDPDNDKDGIPDVADKCPNEAETKNGWQDEDGCPDQVIRELAGIGFKYDSARLDDQSTPILDHAVEILSANPTLSVEISGHTSSEGDGDRNLKLSLDRAEVVKAYLVKKGIAATRILTVGHGSDVPIAENATDEGRSKNRRIEFKILTAADLK